MPPKSKPDNAGYQTLKKDLAEGGTPGRLYIFHGEETYLRDYYLGRLRDKLLSGGMGELTSMRSRQRICPPILWRRRWTACP